MSLKGPSFIYVDLATTSLGTPKLKLSTPSNGNRKDSQDYWVDLGTTFVNEKGDTHSFLSSSACVSCIVGHKYTDPTTASAENYEDLTIFRTTTNDQNNFEVSDFNV